MSRLLVSQYHAEVQKIVQYGGSRKETSIRNAFERLLNDSNCGKEIFSNKVSEAIRSTLNNHSDSSNQEQTEKQYGFGSLKGKIWMSDDFDAPLEELAEYM